MADATLRTLKAELASLPWPQVVPIARFFDGNDDPNSIGCNLIPHPGMNQFRQVLTGLSGRPDVRAVYAQIEELDPGEGRWPFVDTVFVVGTVAEDDLRAVVRELRPAGVFVVRAAPGRGGTLAGWRLPAAVSKGNRAPVSVICWD